MRVMNASKTIKRLEELNQRNFMLVDHNLWGLQFHCNRALLLHNGSLIEFDDLEKAFTPIRSCLNFQLLHTRGIKKMMDLLSVLSL